MHTHPCTHFHTHTHTNSGLSVGLYLTSTAEACFNYASDCKANIIMVENDTQLQKILQVCITLCVCVCVCTCHV